MAVVKIIELVGSSKKSSDDAAQQALKQAQSSLRNIRRSTWSRRARGDNLDEWRAHARRLPGRGHRRRLRLSSLGGGGLPPAPLQLAVLISRPHPRRPARSRGPGWRARWSRIASPPPGVRPSAAAGQHVADLGDVVVADRAGVDRVGKLAAGAGLCPFVAEEVAGGERRQLDLGLAVASAPRAAMCWPGRRSSVAITGESPGVTATTTSWPAPPPAPTYPAQLLRERPAGSARSRRNPGP